MSFYIVVVAGVILQKYQWKNSLSELQWSYYNNEQSYKIIIMTGCSIHW
jgi:hypothetical protein